MRKFEIDYKGLEEYLKTLNRDHFYCHCRGVDNSKVIIKDVNFISYIEKCNIDKSTITLDTVIYPGMPYLIDALGSDISICIKTKRGYRLPTGRVIKAKFDRTIIKDCHKQYGTALNGCWVIPERFIKKVEV